MRVYCSFILCQVYSNNLLPSRVLVPLSIIAQCLRAGESHIIPMRCSERLCLTISIEYLRVRKSDIRYGAPSSRIRSAAISSCDGGGWRPRRYLPSGEPLLLSISYSDLSREQVERSAGDPGKGFQIGELAVGDSGEGKGAVAMVVLLGWLGAEEKYLNSYGYLLKNLQSRSDVIDRIKGCIVDSAPAPEISPKVWAAGYCAALMKRRTSAAYARCNSEGNTDRPNNKDCKPHLLEIIAAFILEKIFSILLFLPDVNQRLSAAISVLSKNQPPCPQLYLYSSADLVIPASSVESFIKEQRAMGRNVRSHNFATSPHVDHFRSFPHIYSAEVSEFVKECCSEIVCRA